MEGADANTQGRGAHRRNLRDRTVSLNTYPDVKPLQTRTSVGNRGSVAGLGNGYVCITGGICMLAQFCYLIPGLQ